jgi:hypothetical protein
MPTNDPWWLAAVNERRYHHGNISGNMLPHTSSPFP